MSSTVPLCTLIEQQGESTVFKIPWSDTLFPYTLTDLDASLCNQESVNILGAVALAVETENNGIDLEKANSSKSDNSVHLKASQQRLQSNNFRNPEKLVDSIYIHTTCDVGRCNPEYCNNPCDILRFKVSINSTGSTQDSSA